MHLKDQEQIDSADRGMALAIAAMGVTGAMLGTAALDKLDQISGLSVVDIEALPGICAAAAGSIISGLLVRRRLGRPGMKGHLIEAGAWVSATFMLAIIAGTFVLPLFGTVYGPLLMLGVLMSKPWLAVPWLLSLYAMGRAVAQYRRARGHLPFHAEPEELTGSDAGEPVAS